MHKLALVAGVSALAALLPAQSPLTTTFASNNGGSVGGAVYFDLQVNVGVIITQLDLNLGTAAATAGSIDVYTIPGTYVGNTTNQSLWTLAGSGPAVSNGSNVATPVTLNAPIVLSPGTYGIAFAGIGHSHRYTNGTGTNQFYSTAELSITAGAASNVAFSGSPFTPRVVNCSIYYQPAAGFASATPYGQGCIERAVSFYESSPTGTFDLGSATGTNATQLIPTGNGYVVTPAAPSWFTPTSPNLGLGDDAISAPQSLPFTINYPGGSTNSITIESNGNIWLQVPSHTGFICDTSPAALLSRGSVICAFYDDLDPSAAGGGTVQFDLDPSNQAAYVTWTAVPIYNATPPSPRPTNTFQVALFSSGVVELRYQGMDSTGSWTNTLCGFSPGQGNRDPGSIDISTSMPIITEADNAALALAATGRPVVGGPSFGLDISNIPASSAVGAMALGFTQYSPGLPLAGLGMPDCFAHATMNATIVTIFSGPTANVNLAIPNVTSLSGFHLFAQAIAIDPTANAFGAVTSNGIDLQLDLQ